jgi:hypothetical protein
MTVVRIQLNVEAKMTASCIDKKQQAGASQPQAANVWLAVVVVSNSPVRENEKNEEREGRD